MYKFFFNNLNLSIKKTKIYIKKILRLSKYVFEILVYFNYNQNKYSKIFKKIFIYIINNIKNKSNIFFKLKIRSILILKSSIIKKFNYRAKGNLNFFKKKYCNIFIISYL